MSWLGPIRQISYTTDDLDRLLRFWESRVGVGPWSVFRNLTLAMRYEGRPIVLPVHVALAMHGETLIELLQVAGAGPSPFHDALDRPIIGLQRLAALSDAYEQDTQAAVDRGMVQFADGVDATGQRYAYFRSPEAPGVILELLENTPFFADFRSRLEARARGYPADAGRASGGVAACAHKAPTRGSMRAAELTGYGDPQCFRISTVVEPLPGRGEIRVKVSGAAVNPVDVKLRRGYLQQWMPLVFPARLGGDVAGVVDAVGEGAGDFRPGDRVMGMINPMADGAYAEKVVAASSSFALVPASLELVEAAALPTGAMTGIQLVERALAVRAGSRGLVTGAGGSVGRAAVITALDAGAVVHAGVRAGSLDACRDLPVAGSVDLADDAAIASVGPFDWIADTVGGAVAEKLFAHVTRDGVVASIAVPPPSPPPGSTQRFVSLIVSFDRARLERYARDLAGRQRRVPVAHTLPLDEVARAHELMEQGHLGGKIVLVP